MYEPRRMPPLSRARFARRFAGHYALAQGVVALSIGIGMTGYMFVAGVLLAPVVHRIIHRFHWEQGKQ
jgi:hypothetical protein